MNVAPFLPTWIAQLPMPLCMAMVAVSFTRKAEGWASAHHHPRACRGHALHRLCARGKPRGRCSCPRSSYCWLGLVAGAPLFTVFGGLALFLFFKDGIPLAAVPSETYRVVSSPTLPTIPLFTLAGYILSEGGASKRLVHLFHALFSWMPGGVAVATVLVCAFFTTFTGASGVTILALGGLLFPMLVKEAYPGAVLSGAGDSIGLRRAALPAVAAHHYLRRGGGHSYRQDVHRLPDAGPDAGNAGVGLWRRAVKIQSVSSQRRFISHTLRRAISVAKWDLLLPVIVIVGIFGGLTTIVEAAALTVLYAIILECFIHKTLTFTVGLPRTMVKCGEIVGGVLIILGFAFGLTNYLIDAEIPALLRDVGAGNDSFKISLPHHSQPAAHRGCLHDGHLQRHRGCGAHHAAHCNGLRHRSGAPGGHVSREPRAWLSHAAHGPEPLLLSLPV